MALCVTRLMLGDLPGDPVGNRLGDLRDVVGSEAIFASSPRPQS